MRRFAAPYLPRLRPWSRPDLVLVFGSRARGDVLAERGLDLLVVSEAFGCADRHRCPLNTPDAFARTRRELGIVSQAVDEGLAL